MNKKRYNSPCVDVKLLSYEDVITMSKTDDKDYVWEDIFDVE